MKQFVKTSEIKRKIEKLVDSANKDFNNGFTSLYDLKNLCIKSIVFIFRGFSMWTRNMGGRYVSSEWVDGFIKALRRWRKLIDMSEIYEALRTSSLRKVSYEDDDITIVAYKVGKIIRIDVKEIK